MGALSIAFDIIIVGALALPWVLLVLRLFFSDDEHTVEKHLDWVKNQKQPALAGVLLFAMTYSLGSAVSRIAQDFFDDDDLYLHASHYLFRVGVTESSIRANVFCNAFRDAETATPSEPPPAKQEPSKTPQEPGNPTAAKHQRFKDNNPDCKYTGRWIVQTYNPDTQERIPVSPGAHEYVNANWINRQEELAQDIFQYQEAAVLLQGTDATERIRQYHDQIMVLRGAAFNSLIAFSLCLFWWSSQSLAGLMGPVILLCFSGISCAIPPSIRDPAHRSALHGIHFARSYGSRLVHSLQICSEEKAWPAKTGRAQGPDADRLYWARRIPHGRSFPGVVGHSGAV